VEQSDAALRSVARGKNPLAAIGGLGPETVATLTSGVPNLGPRVSLVSARAEVLAHLGTQPLGEEPGQFIAPNGIAVDSRGDIYVAEVSNTYWPQLFGKKLDHELRSLQKLARLSRTASPGGWSRFVMCTTVSRRGFVLFFAYLNPAVQPDNIASTICVRGWTRIIRLPRECTSAEVSPDQGIRIGSADERL
jgi:hypothetical protein